MKKTFQTIFWNAGERRLRAGWRLLIQLLLFVLAITASFVPAIVFGQGSLTSIAGSSIYLVLFFVMAWFLARFIDGRRVVDFGFHVSRSWWLDFAFGLLLGAVLMWGIFVTELLAGWVVFSTAVWDSPLAPAVGVGISFVSWLAIAVNEEFTFRGYQLLNVGEGLAGRRLSPRAAIVWAFLISSTLFGVAHAMNQGSTIFSTINIVLAGGLLSLPFLFTGELAISIGLHLAWNFFQGTVFGFPVSGGKPSRKLLNIEQFGPETWTGGPFGPEGGLVSTVWMTVGCVLLLVWLRGRYGPLMVRAALRPPEIVQDSNPPETGTAEIDVPPAGVHTV